MWHAAGPGHLANDIHDSTTQGGAVSVPSVPSPVLCGYVWDGKDGG